MVERKFGACEADYKVRNKDYPKIVDIRCQGCGAVNTLNIKDSAGEKEIPDEIRQICPRLDRFVYRGSYW